MSKKFEECFCEPCWFYPDAFHVSRRKYDSEQAAKLIGRECAEDVKAGDLKPKWVRFQFADGSLREEFGLDHCWAVVREGTKNAQPTWEYECS